MQDLMSFRDACVKGNFEEAKRLWNTHTISEYTLHDQNEDIFRWTCITGHESIAKWLWEISNHSIDIHARDEFAFCGSCESGYESIAKWLWEISNHNDHISDRQIQRQIDLYASNEEVFHRSCMNENIIIYSYSL